MLVERELNNKSCSVRCTGKWVKVARVGNMYVSRSVWKCDWARLPVWPVCAPTRVEFIKLIAVFVNIFIAARLI